MFGIEALAAEWGRLYRNRIPKDSQDLLHQKFSNNPRFDHTQVLKDYNSKPLKSTLKQRI